jgi:hypothetical protein
MQGGRDLDLEFSGRKYVADDTRVVDVDVWVRSEPRLKGLASWILLLKYT